jgi:hypothetical protein
VVLLAPITQQVNTKLKSALPSGTAEIIVLPELDKPLVWSPEIQGI